MIASKDRSGWFGASDTNKIMGNWETEAFRRFWLEKLGIVKNRFTNRYLQAGTYYEHRILSAAGITKTDRQIKRLRLRLRVNLDGENKSTVFEVKTYQKEFKLTKAYWQQCQVEMFPSGKQLELLTYHLLPEDYDNYFNPIDINRMGHIPVAFQPEFLDEYLPRLRYLSYCLRQRKTPNTVEYKEARTWK